MYLYILSLSLSLRTCVKYILFISKDSAKKAKEFYCVKFLDYIMLKYVYVYV